MKVFLSPTFLFFLVSCIPARAGIWEACRTFLQAVRGNRTVQESATESISPHPERLPNDSPIERPIPHRITTVEKNIHTLKKQFHKHLLLESMSGNAGTNRLAINMAVSPNSGRIAMVGNIQDYPPHVRERIRQHTMLKVTVLMSLDGSYSILGITDINEGSARDNLQNSLRQFLQR